MAKEDPTRVKDQLAPAGTHDKGFRILARFALQAPPFDFG